MASRSIPLMYSCIFLLLLPSFSQSHSEHHHFLTLTNLHNTSNSSSPSFTSSLELTPPLPTSTLPSPPPECTLSLLNYTYNTTASVHPPITLLYSPPSDCAGPWSHVVLFLSGAVSGNFSGRISSVFLSGAEIIRTSTPEPYANGTAWNFTKVITRYSSLLNQSEVPVSIVIENLVNGGFDGVYDGVFEFNLTLLYYKENAVVTLGNRKLGLGAELRGLEGDGVYDEPADLVIPVGSDGDEINWFRIDKVSNVSSRNVTIPMNARKVVVEFYVSSHGDDEFWYSNPPDSYILANNLTSARGNGAYREVFVRIDGQLVGSEVPFPVVYTGGINPLFWRPVVGIGAFDLPTYDFDLTPYLGLLLDGQSHKFELGVSNAINYWLVDANLHVWLDKGGVVQANVGVVRPTETKQKFEYDFKHLDGKFEIEVERKSQSLGWVASSLGNFTTYIEKELKFKSKMKYKNNGALKIIKQKIKVKMQVTVSDETGSTVSQSSLKRKYPLTLTISTMPGPDIDTHLMITNISQSLEYEFSNDKLSGSIQNTQDAGGWVLLQNESVLSGVADTQQNLSYRGASGCITRAVQASGGKLVRDESINTCNSLLQKVFNVLLESW